MKILRPSNDATDANNKIESTLLECFAQFRENYPGILIELDNERANQDSNYDIIVEYKGASTIVSLNSIDVPVVSNSAESQSLVCSKIYDELSIAGVI